MNIRNSPLVLALLLTSLAASAQQPPSAPSQELPAATSSNSSPASSAASSGTPKQPAPAHADYHFQLGHMYEDMVAGTGRAEFATKAVDEYKATLQADPTSSYLA